MDNPAALQLTFDQNGAFPIVGPGVMQGDVAYGLEGMLSATLQAKFMYGGGGVSATLYVQTSIDQGQTWIDIWAQEFTAASAVAVVNLSALDKLVTPYTPTNQGLTPGTAEDGILGDRLQAVVVVAGNYTGSTSLNVTAVVR